MRMYERVPVSIVSIDDTDMETVGGVTHPLGSRYAIEDLFDLMVGMTVREQIYLLANTLTAAGYSQGEIAKALKVDHQSYRNTIWKIRSDFRDKGIQDL